MTTYKVSELQGALLDAAVALVEGYEVQPGNEHWVRRADTGVRMTPWFSRDWAVGGPIIQRDLITIVASDGSDSEDPLEWSACVGAFSHYIDEQLPFSSYGNDPPVGIGPTPLIAAMRSYVASKFGDTVEMP